MKRTSASIFLASLVMTSMASAVTLIVDFTTAGPDGTVFSAAVPSNFVFSSQDIGGTGVSFDITSTAVNPGGGQTGATGDRSRLNGGLGSTVENTGTFLNVINDVTEELTFTISNVVGLLPGQSLQLNALLSQNSRSLTANQSGGYGGTFGQAAADSVTLTSDNASTVVIAQSDAGNLGSILLNGDGNNATNTGNTFEHLGTLDFTSSFDLEITGTVNNAVVIQGFDFVVIPEPSSSLIALGGLGLLLIRRRRA